MRSVDFCIELQCFKVVAMSRTAHGSVCTYWSCELTPIRCILTAKHDAFNAPVGTALNNEEELRGEIFWMLF